MPAISESAVAAKDAAGPLPDGVPDGPRAVDDAPGLQDGLSTVGTGGRGGRSGSQETGGATETGDAGGTTVNLGGMRGGQTSGYGGSSQASQLTMAGGTCGNGGTSGAAGATAIGDDTGSCAGAASVDAGQGIALSQNLVAYYACELISATQLIDSSDCSRNATLASDAGAAGASFVSGKVGNALHLVQSNKAYAKLPAGLLERTCDMTIATWVYLNSQSAWQRTWNFNTDSPSGVFMFLTTSNDQNGNPRFGITLHDKPAEQSLDGPSPLPTKVWKHLAVVLSASGASLYVDGIQVASSASVTLRPADMGGPLTGYIGRSHYAWDPYFDGNFDEFRIYNRALSPAEIKALYAGD